MVNVITRKFNFVNIKLEDIKVEKSFSNSLFYFCIIILENFRPSPGSFLETRNYIFDEVH